MDNCRLCKKDNLTVLLDIGEHPIAHHFLTDPSGKEYLHQMTLCFCNNCGLVQLINPITPYLLYTNYICLSSWKYQPHISHLIELIEKNTDLSKESNILEIGSNDGIFLEALYRRGYKKLIGIEPAKDAQAASRQKGIETIPAYFNTQTAKKFVKEHGNCDILISRQMLEHVDDLKELQEAISIVLSPNGFALFEVPDFGCNLETLDYSIWEEHVSYFTPETMKFFLSSAGITVLHTETLLFSGNALVVIGKYTGRFLAHNPSGYLEELHKKVLRYKNEYPVFKDSFIKYLSQHKNNGKTIAAYGAGARLCSIINFLGLKDYVDFIVDDQPEKQGKYMPGSKLPILPSSALNSHSVDICLLAVNAECEDKVIAKHVEFQKKGGCFVSVLPPSARLPEFWNSLIHDTKGFPS